MFNIHWLRVEFLYLIPLSLIAMWFYKKKCQQDFWETVVSPHLLKYLTISQHTVNRWLPWFMMMLLWLSFIALAGPSWKQQTVSVYRANNPLVILLDTSPAMLAQDVSPSRMDRARFKILEIIKHHHDQLGLVAFSSHPFTVSPITDDGHTLTTLLHSLSPHMMPVAGQDIGHAIQYGSQLLEQAGYSHGQLLLITPGPITIHDIQAAKQLKNYYLSVLGIGTQQGAPIMTEQGITKDNDGNIQLSRLHTASLKKLALAGGGQYQALTLQNDDIQHLLPHRKEKLSQHAEKLTVWQDQGYYLLWLMLPFVALLFRRGWIHALLKT